LKGHVANLQQNGLNEVLSYVAQEGYPLIV